MVGSTGRTADPRRIRRLKLPRDLEVEADGAGVPLRLRLYGVWQDVSLIRRSWRIDQHWWRGDPLRRDYFQVVVQEDRTPLTIYQDLVSGEWARQDY